jgi:hypothetical protein
MSLLLLFIIFTDLFLAEQPNKLYKKKERKKRKRKEKER